MVGECRSSSSLASKTSRARPPWACGENIVLVALLPAARQEVLTTHTMEYWGVGRNLTELQEEPKRTVTGKEEAGVGGCVPRGRAKARRVQYRAG